MIYRIIAYVYVPVISIVDGITGEKPSHRGVVETMPQPHQSGHRVVLVAVLPGEPERRRGSSRAGDVHPEGVGVEAVRFGLAAIGYRPRRAKSVRRCKRR